MFVTTPQRMRMASSNRCVLLSRLRPQRQIQSRRQRRGRDLESHTTTLVQSCIVPSRSDRLVAEKITTSCHKAWCPGVSSQMVVFSARTESHDAEEEIVRDCTRGLVSCGMRKIDSTRPHGSIARVVGGTIRFRVQASTSVDRKSRFTVRCM